MDEEIRSFMKRNKKIVVASGLVGFLVTPFLWPFFLAIIFSTIRLAVPIFLILLGIKLPCRGCRKIEKEASKVHDCATEAENAWAEKNNTKERVNEDEQREKTVAKPSGKEDEPVPEAGPDEGKKAGGRQYEADRRNVLKWYYAEGRDGILRLAKRMESAGYNGMSIQNDGLCFVKEKRGYRRIGAVRDFPEKKMEVVAELLERDGMSYAKVRGKYILLFWKQTKGGKH